MSRSVIVLWGKHVSRAPVLTFISSETGKLDSSTLAAGSSFFSERGDFRVFPPSEKLLKLSTFKKINKKIGLHFPPSNILEVMSSCCVLAGIVSRGCREDYCRQAVTSG